MAGAPDARIAVVSSGVASMFVAKCSPATVAWFLAPHDEAEVLDVALKLVDPPAALANLLGRFALLGVH